MYIIPNVSSLVKITLKAMFFIEALVLHLSMLVYKNIIQVFARFDFRISSIIVSVI